MKRVHGLNTTCNVFGLFIYSGFIHLLTVFSNGINSRAPPLASPSYNSRYGSGSAEYQQYPTAGVNALYLNILVSDCKTRYGIIISQVPQFAGLYCGSA